MTRPYGHWALGLGLGAAGGGLFAALDLPLPWMLGALTATLTAALSGWSPDIPKTLRTGMISVLGLMLGSAFAPDLLERVGRWAGSMAVLLVAMIVTTALVVVYLRRTAGMDTVTAFFAGAPGGINEMVITGTALGGDERGIALSHSLRILLIVFTVPFGYRIIAHIHSVPMAQSMGQLVNLSGADALALVILAQVVTGAAIGSRFRGLGWGEVAMMARPALGATAIMLVISAGAALLLALAGDLPFAALLLAFVPGGIAEMCLVALALGQDVAFVSTHHVVRVVLVIMLAPLAFRLLSRKGALP